jgi:hypothetical protein
MIRTARVLRRAFTGACVAWAGALPAAAFVAARPQAAAPAYLFAVAIYAIGSVVCHQLPARSFHLWGRQLPVCARCTGIYVGAALAVAVFAGARWVARSPTPARRFDGLGVVSDDVDRRRLRLAVIVAALPTAATLVVEWTTHVTPANGVRAAAGLVLGAAVAWVVARELAANPEVN